MDEAMVLIDRSGRTAILIRQTESALRLIEMDAGELALSRMSEDEFAERGFRPLDYPIGRAIRRFLAHAGGVSEAARKALEDAASHAGAL